MPFEFPLDFGLVGLGPLSARIVLPQHKLALHEQRQIFRRMCVKHASRDSADTSSDPHYRNVRTPEPRDDAVPNGTDRRITPRMRPVAVGTSIANCVTTSSVRTYGREASSDPSDACRESRWHYFVFFDPIRTQNAVADIPIKAKRPLEGSGTAAVTLALSA